jgi:hypothetical protein
MKKLSCLLLVFCLVVPYGSAQTTTADDFQAYIESLPSDFLKTLIATFNAELVRRGETTVSTSITIDKEVTVPVGTYIVGEDIPAGNYTIRCAEDDCFSFDVRTATGKLVFSEFVYSGDHIGKVILQNGNKVEIEFNAVIFAPYKGLGF